MVMVMEIAGEASTVEISATEMAAATHASEMATAQAAVMTAAHAAAVTAATAAHVHAATAATPAAPAAAAFGEGVMGKRNTAEGENRRHGCNFE